MTRLIYVAPVPISREDAEVVFASGDSTKMCDALLGITYHPPDLRWVEETCITMTSHPDSDVRGLAALCLGYLLRFYGVFDTPRVLPILERLLEDEEVGWRADDALSEVHACLPRTRENASIKRRITLQRKGWLAGQESATI